MKYNAEDLNNIPIVNVAEKLGIDVDRCNKAFCFRNHDKNTKSLSFQKNKNFFHCFGCGVGGGTINLVMEYYNIGFIEACEWLYHVFNLTRPSLFFFENNSSKKLEDKNFASNFVFEKEIYASLFNNAELSCKGLEYLTQNRGIKKNIVKEFFIKDLEDPINTIWHLVELFGKDRVSKSGLLKLDRNNKLKPIWWEHTIIFPFFDLEERITYVQGRYISQGDLKYVNLFKVPTRIFNFNVITRMQTGERLFICEGIPDTILLTQRGYRSIGILGALNFKKEYVKHLMYFDIFVVPDNDKGGNAFFERVSSYFEEVGKPVKRLRFDATYNDISDYINRGKNEFN